jgi:S-adenosylmethionine hydrolase
MALRRETVKRAVVLTNQKFFLSKISSTFHGRDIFAPVAAHLSLGRKPESFGSSIKSWHEISFPDPAIKRGNLVGEIVHVDAFGNLISNIDRKNLLKFSKRGSISVRLGEKTIYGLKRGYWEATKREPSALIGSGDFLEIAVREGNAQKALDVKRGDKVTVSLWSIVKDS